MVEKVVLKIKGHVAEDLSYSEKLVKWKAKFGNDSKFISKDGFPFNAFDDEWRLNGMGDLLNLSWFYNNKKLTDDMQCKYRIALASLATNLAVFTVIDINRMVRNSIFTGFSQPELQTTYSIINVSRQTKMKTLIRELYELYPNVFSVQWEWISDKKASKIKRKIWDIDKGALSTFEEQSSIRQYNIHMKALLEKIKSEPLNGNMFDFYVDQLRNMIEIRLINSLVRRPVNIQQMKWSDIIPVGAVFKDRNNLNTIDFSDEVEFQVRMWKAKNKSTFREDVEKHALLLNAVITNEVILYRSYYRKRFKKRMACLGISLSDNQLNKLLIRCPVIYSDSLFTTEFSSKKELDKAISINGSGFHDSTLYMSARRIKLIQSLNIKSDRVPDMKWNNNRIRHTAGTNANMQGYNENEIGRLLGNTATAARIYIDLSDEQRVNVDDKYIVNALLKRIFDSDLITLKKDARFAIIDDLGNEAGQAKYIEPCNKCEETRPLGCYGCDNFNAFEDGDHSAILEQAQQKYNARINLGEPVEILGKLATQIQWVRATIDACEEVLLSRSALNEESL